MKMMKIPAAVVAGMLFSMTAYPQHAQHVTQESIKALEQREADPRLSGYRAELAELKSDWAKAKQKADAAAETARKSADANKEAAGKLAGNPKDKSLAGNANKLAKTAQKDARAARKAADDLADVEKKIAGLQDKMNEESAKIAVYPAALNAASAKENASAKEAAAIPVEQTPAQADVAMNPARQVIVTDTVRGMATANRIAEKVIEHTYKSYPQQAGQPAIIINNIVVPPDYNRQAVEPRPAPSRQGLSEEEMREFEAFRAWRNSRKASPAPARNADALPAREEPSEAAVQAPQPAQRLTFTERFGEMKPRRSGMWVIPMVGLHASSFEADFSDDEAKGRSGWNAGLDFRAHQKRFFIQPGVHYFSSSMDVSSKDSLSNAPFLKGPRIHSLKVPLLAGIYLTRERGAFLKVNLKGGIVGNYVLSVDKNSQNRFTKDNIEEFSYGLNGGLGIEFGLLTIDLSHEWGMSPLFKDDKSKNNILRATIGIKI